MRLLAIWIISAVLLFGYQRGEQLSPKLVKQLDLKEGKVYVIDKLLLKKIGAVE